MPISAPKPCAHIGCGKLVSNGRYCPAHLADGKKASNFNKRLSRHERGYGYSWEKLRVLVLQRDAGLCQPCWQSGRLTVANIVDHKTPKAEGGTDDLDNLQVICRACHTLKTAGESARGGKGVQFEPDWLPAPVVPVVVVCGPPGCGKSTYVMERAASTDLVLDVDVIAADLFGLALYHANRDQRMAAIRYRNKMLAALGEAACSYSKAWLIVTAGSHAKREFWRGKYRELVVMNTPKLECVERVKNDSRRPEDAKRYAIRAIYEWA